jgi:glycosyltransferase involved in cell wall biosynthesis
VPNSHFVVVGRVPSNGKWYMGYLLKLLRKLDLYKYFSFTGFVPREQLPLYLSAADLFALPSYCEGAPLVIPGAMACGRLVVATRSADAGYLPQDLVVENGNYSELAGKIAYYLSDLKRCRLIGNELRLKALREFSWKKIAEKTYELYRKSP